MLLSAATRTPMLVACIGALTPGVAGCYCRHAPLPGDAGTDGSVSLDAPIECDRASAEEAGDFLLRVGHAVCTSHRSCAGGELRTFSTMEDCLADNISTGPGGLGMELGWDNVIAAAEEGRVRIVEPHASRCVAALSRVCALADSLGGEFTDHERLEACHRAIELCEPRNLGDECTADWECPAEAYCGNPPTQCTGNCCPRPFRCVPYPREGEACARSDCFVPGGVGVCRSECRAIDVLDAVGEGDVCGLIEPRSVTAQPCAAGLVCHAYLGILPTRCVRPLAIDERCESDFPCGPDLVCHGGFCRALAAPEPPGTSPCGPYCLFQRHTACVPDETLTTSVCRATDGTEGSPCDIDIKCGSGLFCDGVRCARQRPRGASCDLDGAACASGCCGVDGCS